MVEQNIGFRFDIYERIHLPEGILAIRDLEEIELIPYFQGIPGDEQTQLRGNLQLTAVYESIQEGTGKQTFIHRIPVEISLPVRTNDVSSQEIQVKIDQFDVELVTDRSLNVTGILSLAGWEQSRTESFDNHSEEFYAEHQVESERTSEYQAAQEHVEEKAQELFSMGNMVEPVAQSEEWIQAEVIMDDNKEEEIELSEQEVAPKLDMKVAIKPQLHTEAALEILSDLPVKSEKANNSLEWKRLFLVKEEAVQFKRMRMCIVQKEDTLQTIADRYELQPREIALYNRLGEVDVSEGQIIYIPKSNV
ncbi:MAG: LysM peptidoglycan-binding domain-containing protein [Paenibacillaceae bacterium]